MAISECNQTSSCDKPELLVQQDQIHLHRAVYQIHQLEAFPIHQHDNQMNNPIKHNATCNILLLLLMICLLLLPCNSQFSSCNCVRQLLLFHLFQKRNPQDS